MANSNSKSGQIPLVLPIEAATSRDDLLEGNSNQLAVDLIDTWPNWPSNVIVLAGPVGAGKTHLASVWAQLSNATILQMNELAEHANIAEKHNIVLEDAQSGSIDEEALFHTFNQAKAHGNSIIITSRTFPSSWMIELPDLLSRLK